MVYRAAYTTQKTAADCRCAVQGQAHLCLQQLGRLYADIGAKKYTSQLAGIQLLGQL